MRWLTCCLVAGTLLCCAVRSARPAPPPDPAARIQHRLEQPATVDFADTPLSDVVEFLAEQFDLPLHVDRRALEDAGLGIDTRITLRVRRPVKLSSILRMISRQHDLAFVPDDDILLLTTSGAAEEMLVARVYPVADLVPAAEGPPDVPPLPGQLRRQYDELRHVIQAAVAPDSWSDLGGLGDVSVLPGQGVLVIYQTHDAHRAVARLLEQLRASRRSASEPDRHSPQP